MQITKALATSARVAIRSILVPLAAIAAILAMVTYMGWVDVGADSPHGKTVYSLIQFARERSVARHAQGIEPPADLSSRERVRRGAGNYDAMCVDCHLAPGIGNTEIRRGLYPEPPNLSLAAAGDLAPANETAARRFWIIKHGIKGSGMPAWSQGGMEDEAIWDLTAFIGALPKLSVQEYREEVAASEGHSHAGMATRQPQAVKPPRHDHDAQPHRHDHH